MDRYALIEQLDKMIGDYLLAQDYELIELIYRHEGRDLFLRVLADRPEGGITLDECSRLNNQIGSMLDEQDIIQEKYILEVSSPGLDRSLRLKSDFVRCLNKKAKFFLNDFVEGKIEWDGLITKVEDESIFIDVNGRLLNIPLSKINKAKQLF